MIQILLATYNGEKYIKAQLESLFKQTYTNFEILVSDDGSKDRTVEIIEEFQKLYPGKIRFVPDKTPSGGAKNNFFKLMGYADADYIMFCDQDDYWLPDKIEQTFKKMKETEQAGIPVLVHTDLYVTNEKLDIMHKSYLKLQYLKPTHKINRALVQNCVTGCTVMINKPLMELAKSRDGEDIIMHDWWLYLISTAFGKTVFLNRQTILYRQHSKNEIGAKGFKYRKREDLKVSLLKTYNQAEHFYSKFKDNLSVEHKALLTEYKNIKIYSKIKKIYTIFRYRFFKHSILREFAHLLVC